MDFIGTPEQNQLPKTPSKSIQDISTYNKPTLQKPHSSILTQNVAQKKYGEIREENESEEEDEYQPGFLDGVEEGYNIKKKDSRPTSLMHIQQGSSKSISRIGQGRNLSLSEDSKKLRISSNFTSHEGGKPPQLSNTPKSIAIGFPMEMLRGASKNSASANQGRQNSSYTLRNSPDNYSNHYSSNHNDQVFTPMRTTQSKVDSNLEAKQMMHLGQSLSSLL